MPRFSNHLPTEAKHQGFDLKRTPPAAPISGIVTCDDILVCDTHFFAGRTVPCERIVNEHGRTIDDSPCPACQRKQAWRSHVYVSAFATKTAEHFIFECSTNAAKAFAEYRAANPTLRGCGFTANRPKCTANAKVVIVTTAMDLAKRHIPQAPNVERCLAIIWRIPLVALERQPENIDGLSDEAGYARTADHVHTDATTMAQMRTPLDDSPADADIETMRAGFLADLQSATDKQHAKKNGKPKCDPIHA